MKQRKQPFTLEEFQAIYSKVPRLCVDLLIICEGKVLMTLRTKNGWKGLWHLPGGTIYLNEKIPDAARRIGKEELGIEVKVEKFLGYQDWINLETGPGFGSGCSLVFLCQINGLDKIVLDDGALEYRLFDTIPENIVEEHREWVKKGLTSEA
jgi:ADP-ribose pyrophosphatase YjhB (NUDIX family)